MLEQHHFPAPWTVEELDGACFIVKDRSGQPLAHVYYGEGLAQQTTAKQLTRNDARRLAAIIAALPGLVQQRLDA